MTVKYHNGPNGPARCTATKRACPVGGEHFESMEAAGVAYEAQMNQEYGQLLTFVAKKVQAAPEIQAVNSQAETLMEERESLARAEDVLELASSDYDREALTKAWELMKPVKTLELTYGESEPPARVSTLKELAESTRWRVEEDLATYSDQLDNLEEIKGNEAAAEFYSSK